MSTDSRNERVIEKNAKAVDELRIQSRWDTLQKKAKGLEKDTFFQPLACEVMGEACLRLGGQRMIADARKHLKKACTGPNGRLTARALLGMLEYSEGQEKEAFTQLAEVKSSDIAVTSSMTLYEIGLIVTALVLDGKLREGRMEDGAEGNGGGKAVLDCYNKAVALVDKHELDSNPSRI